MWNFCYKFVRRITFFYSCRIYCVQFVCGMDGVLCFMKCPTKVPYLTFVGHFISVCIHIYVKLYTWGLRHIRCGLLCPLGTTIR